MRRGDARLDWEVARAAAPTGAELESAPAPNGSALAPRRLTGASGDLVPSVPSRERVREALLALASRRRIYERIQAVPGIHLRRLARESRVAVGTLEHHVRMLERHGLVQCHKEGTRRAYFALEGVDEADVRGLFLLRNRKWRPILLELLAVPGQTFEELHQALAVHGSTLAYHLRRLCEHRALDRTSVGRSSLYHLREPERLKRLVTTYRSTFRGLGPAPAPVVSSGPLQFLLARLPPPEPRPTRPQPLAPAPRLLEA